MSVAVDRIDISIVEAFAFRELPEPAMVARVAARWRDKETYITLEEAKAIARKVAGGRSLTRLKRAIYDEVRRQNAAVSQRNETRTHARNPYHYDPVYFRESDIRRHGDTLSLDAQIRLVGLFKHAIGGETGFVAAMGSATPGVLEVKVIAGRPVALVRPHWAKGTRGNPPGYLIALVPGQKPVALRVKHSIKTVGDALHSLLPDAAVRGINAKRSVKVDWVRRLIGVWPQHGNDWRWWSFRRVGITRQGATDQGWRVVEAEGDVWLRAMT